MKLIHFSNTYTILRRCIVALLAASALSACTSTSSSNDSLGASNYDTNQNRHSEQFQTCLFEAENIGLHAEQTASPAQYLTSANAMNACLSNYSQSVGSETTIMQQERMQAMAVITLNYIKAGDMNAATRSVEHFRQRYPNKDLYFSDYTSFIDTATALTASTSLTSSQLSTLNISRALRDEVERKQYWLSH